MHILSVEKLSVAELACRCQEENLRYAAQKPHNGDFCYELFFRALVEQEEEAWTYLYYQFEAQVIYWARRHSRFALTEKTAVSLTNEAFMRMFQALRRLDAHLFRQRFPTLGSLLAYLKRCAGAAVHDAANKAGNQAETAVLHDELQAGRIDASDPVADAEFRAELWAAINRHLKTEVERTVFYESYVLERSIAEIVTDHPELQENNQVYRIRANILRRLRKDPGLERFLQ